MSAWYSQARNHCQYANMIHDVIFFIWCPLSQAGRSAGGASVAASKPIPFRRKHWSMMVRLLHTNLTSIIWFSNDNVTLVVFLEFKVLLLPFLFALKFFYGWMPMVHRIASNFVFAVTLHEIDLRFGFILYCTTFFYLFIICIFKQQGETPTDPSKKNITRVTAQISLSASLCSDYDECMILIVF
jgi:hypothetical protein